MRRLVVALAVLLIALVPGPVVAGNQNPGILPLTASLGGHTYGEWSALWWQWALGAPASVNPLFDETGASCATDQSGHVWFLAGVINVSGTATRTCAIPAGTALFLPVLNVEWDNYTCIATPTSYTEAELRAIAAGIADQASGLVADVDGVPVANVGAYRVTSPVFAITLPENNIYQDARLGCPGGNAPGTYPGAVGDGFFLMLSPLAAGSHTIHFGGSFPGFTLDVTYNLTVG